MNFEEPTEYLQTDNCTVERSHSRDRRVSSGTGHYHLMGGRRKSGCRRGIQYNYFVDLYPPFYIAVVTCIMMLSVIDALMTTTILSAGGKEINILMDELLQQDINLFVQVKLALTGLGLIILTRYVYFKIFDMLKVFHLLLVVLAGYTTLVIYELAFFL
jgi:hypothetical protein